MLYHGQEVGAAALEPAGYGGHQGRTSIFDYTAIPELQAWFNGGRCDGARLRPEQKQLRNFYGRLLSLARAPAFIQGRTLALNQHNIFEPDFARVAGEPASGHWLYAFLRHDPQSGNCWLVAAHFDATRTVRGVSLRVPATVTKDLPQPSAQLQIPDRLANLGSLLVSVETDGGWLIHLPAIPPLQAGYFELFPQAVR